MAKRKAVGARLDDDVREFLEKEAASIRRNLSWLINEICGEWVRSRKAEASTAEERM
jgi:predicted transcriptional regulator